MKNFYLFFISLSLCASENKLVQTSDLDAVNAVSVVRELQDQTFFSKHLSLHDQLSNRVICKGIRNYSFEEQTKKDIAYWIKNSCGVKSEEKELAPFFKEGTLHYQVLQDNSELSSFLEQKKDNNKTVYRIVMPGFFISEFETYNFFNFLEKKYPKFAVNSTRIIDKQVYTQYLFNKHQKYDITPKINNFLCFLLKKSSFQTYMGALKIFNSQSRIPIEQSREVCLQYIIHPISDQTRDDILNTLKNNMDEFYALFHGYILNKFDKKYSKYNVFHDDFIRKSIHKLFSTFFEKNGSNKDIVEFIKMGQKFQNIQQEIAVELLYYKSAAFFEWAMQTLNPHSFFTICVHHEDLDKDLIEEIYNQRKELLQEFLLQQTTESLKTYLPYILCNKSPIVQKELMYYVFTNNEISERICEIFENDHSAQKVSEEILFNNKYKSRPYSDIIDSQLPLPQQLIDFSLQQIERCTNQLSYQYDSNKKYDWYRKYDIEYSVDTRKLSTMLLLDLPMNNCIASGVSLRLLAFMNNDPDLSFDARYKLIYKVVNDSNLYINQYKNSPVTENMVLDLSHFINSLNAINEKMYKSINLDIINQETKNAMIQLKNFVCQIETRLIETLNDNDTVINPYILGCFMKMYRMQRSLGVFLEKSDQNANLRYTKKIGLLSKLFNQLRFCSNELEKKQQCHFLLKSVCLEAEFNKTDSSFVVLYENIITIVKQIKRHVNKDVELYIGMLRSDLSYPFLYFDISKVKDYLKREPHYLIIKDLILDYREQNKNYKSCKYYKKCREYLFQKLHVFPGGKNYDSFEYLIDNIGNPETLKRYCLILPPVKSKKFEEPEPSFNDKVTLLMALYAPHTSEKIKIIEDIIQSGIEMGFYISIHQIYELSSLVLDPSIHDDFTKSLFSTITEEKILSFFKSLFSWLAHEWLTNAEFEKEIVWFAKQYELDTLEKIDLIVDFIERLISFLEYRKNKISIDIIRKLSETCRDQSLKDYFMSTILSKIDDLQSINGLESLEEVNPLKIRINAITENRKKIKSYVVELLLNLNTNAKYLENIKLLNEWPPGEYNYKYQTEIKPNIERIISFKSYFELKKLRSHFIKLKRTNPAIYKSNSKFLIDSRNICENKMTEKRAAFFDTLKNTAKNVLLLCFFVGLPISFLPYAYRLYKSEMALRQYIKQNGAIAAC